jgi:hypothetical protein
MRRLAGDLGVSETSLVRYITGDRRAPDAIAHLLLERLGVAAVAFVRGDRDLLDAREVSG